MTQIKLTGLLGSILILSLALPGLALPIYKKRPIEVSFQIDRVNYRFLAQLTEQQLPDNGEGPSCALTFENTLLENEKGQLSKISSDDLVTLLKKMGWYNPSDLIQYQSAVMSEKDMPASQLSSASKWGQKTFIINTFRLTQKGECQR